MKRHLILVLSIVLAACNASPTSSATPLPTAPPTPVPTRRPTPTPSPTSSPTATALPTFTATPSALDRYVNAEYGLNLRAAPSTDARVFEILLFGAHVTLIEEATAPDLEGILWHNVHTDEGQTGWVASEYLTTEKIQVVPDPFVPYTIEALRLRNYDTGPIEIIETLEDNAAFTRYAIAYPSDGLRVTAMLNVPKGSGAPDEKFPVIILNHGYVDPERFPTGSYIRGEADYLARNGYLTLSPNYRGHAGGQGDAEAAGPTIRGENTFRVGYAVDVLNLLHAVPGIAHADAERIGMWGHSMGGGITLKVLTVDRGRQVDAAVLYGAMSGDETLNLRHISQLWQRGVYQMVTDLFGTPEDNPIAYARISPLTYLNDIVVPVSIHHGAIDDQVPPAWSEDLAQRLNAAGKTVEYFSYEGQNHSLTGDAWRAFMQRVTAFFDQHVKNAGE